MNVHPQLETTESSTEEAEGQENHGENQAKHDFKEFRMHILSAHPKSELSKRRKKSEENHFLMQFSVALLALRFLRGAILLSQLRVLG